MRGVEVLGRENFSVNGPSLVERAAHIDQKIKGCVVRAARGVLEKISLRHDLMRIVANSTGLHDGFAAIRQRDVTPAEECDMRVGGAHLAAPGRKNPSHPNRPAGAPIGPLVGKHSQR
jgi:hypothetical protein